MEWRFLGCWLEVLAAFFLSFSVQDLTSEQRESCGGRVDRVRNQGNEGSIGSFVYIECD